MSSSPDPELMQLFDFGVSDLAANRDGTITSHQIQMLNDKTADTRFAIGCLPFAVVIVLFCGFLFTRTDPRNADPSSDTLLIVLGIFCLATVTWILFDKLGNRSAEVQHPIVKAVGGEIRVYMKQMGQIHQHTLHISGLDFAIKPSTYVGMESYILRTGQDQHYKVFYTEKTKTVLSIEALS